MKIKTIKGANFTLVNLESPREYRINGLEPKPTFSRDWFYIDGDLETVSKTTPRQIKNTYYKLKNKELASDKIPEIITNLEYELDDYCSKIWIGIHEGLEGLYEAKHEYEEEKIEEIDFEEIVILQNDEFKFGVDFDFEKYKSKWESDGFKKVEAKPSKYLFESDVIYRELDKLLFPEVILRDNFPVKMTSKTLYDIIRAYLNQNINRAVSEISSDYKFCYQVDKKINYPTPKTTKEEIFKKNGRSYSPSRYVHKTYTTHSTHTIFEMTNKEDRYKGYTPVPDIYADNLYELDLKVKEILEELIDFINEPIELCPHCEGTGTTTKDAKKINTNTFFNR